MRYDDTLETVLAGDVATSFGKASAWRQLIDLIGRRRVAADPRAFDLLHRIRDAVPVGVRAASARALENANPPGPLVALCALDDISVAAPLLRGARMTSGEWVELLPRLSSAARSVLRARRDLPPGIDRALEAFGPVDFVVTGDVAPPIEAIVEPQPPHSAQSDAADTPEAIVAEAIDAPEPPAVTVPTPDPHLPVVADLEQEPEFATAPLAVEPMPTDLLTAAEEHAAEPEMPEASALVASVPPEAESADAFEPADPGTVIDPEPLAFAAGEPVLDAVARVESRLRLRLRPVLEPVEPPQPAEIPAHTSTFVSVGAAVLGIPVVARALESEDRVDEGRADEDRADEDRTHEDSADVAPESLVQSGTDPEPPVATQLAAESAQAHASDMDDAVNLAEREPGAIDARNPHAAVEGPFEISDVVARIDAFYTLQQERVAQAPPPARVDGFRFETDEQGVIRWVEGVSRAPLIGLSLELTASSAGSRADGIAAGALRQRAVFSDARLIVMGESDAAGEWRMSATPVFDRATGRFAGYRGTARRPRREENAAPIARRETPASDALRQLMHELRTPTNAIAGFAEMIEREMLGDAPLLYRERAGTIRTHARALLAAIDDLDIAARIEASALQLASGEVALRPILSRIADDLDALADLRGAWIALPIDDPAVRGDARAIERMLSRLLATLLSAAGHGERVGAQVRAEGGIVAIAFDRPAALAGHDEDGLFGLDDEHEDAALLGTGFALRLVRNIARELGGRLSIAADAITVELPAMVTKSLEQAR